MEISVSYSMTKQQSRLFLIQISLSIQNPVNNLVPILPPTIQKLLLKSENFWQVLMIFLTPQLQFKFHLTININDQILTRRFLFRLSMEIQKNLLYSSDFQIIHAKRISKTPLCSTWNKVLSFTIKILLLKSSQISNKCLRALRKDGIKSKIKLNMKKIDTHIRNLAWNIYKNLSWIHQLNKNWMHRKRI